MAFIRRHTVAAVTTIAAIIGSLVAGAPWGSALGLPFGVIAKEIERGRTDDLRRRAIVTASSTVRGALDARLRMPALEPLFVKYDELPRIRAFAEIDDVGRVGEVFLLGRDGYQLEEQLRKLSASVAAATGGSAPHLSARAQRALARFVDSIAAASEAAGTMTFAEAKRSHALMRSEGRDIDPVAARTAESDRIGAAQLVRHAIDEALGAETELLEEAAQGA